MALFITAPFERGGAFPLDKLTVLKLSEMKTVDDNTMPPVYFCVCEDDGKIYVYDKSNTADDTTGKYRVLDGGGLPYREVTQAQYDALTPEERAGICFFITDAGGGGGGGGTAEITIIDPNATYTPNQMDALLRKPPLYIKRSERLDAITDWSYYQEGEDGYLYIYVDIGTNRTTYYWTYDAYALDQPMTYTGSSSQKTAGVLTITAYGKTAHGRVQQGDNYIAFSSNNGHDGLTDLYYTNVASSSPYTVKTKILQTDFQAANVMKKGTVTIPTMQAGAFATTSVILDELAFASGEDYTVMLTSNSADAIVAANNKDFNKFEVDARNISGVTIPEFTVDYIILSNKINYRFAMSDGCIDAQALGSRYTCAMADMNQSGYNCQAVLQRKYVGRVRWTNGDLAVFRATATNIFIRNNIVYLEIEWDNPTPALEPFRYFARSGRGIDQGVMYFMSAEDPNFEDDVRFPTGLLRVEIVEEVQ